MSSVINERVKTVCPQCNEQRSVVLEVRRSKTGLRRRFECAFCSHRFTTYEITETTYKEFIGALQFKNKVFSLFNELKTLNLLQPFFDLSVSDKLEQIEDIRCFSCRYYSNNLCSFDLPEAGTEDAVDCNMYVFYET